MLEFHFGVMGSGKSAFALMTYHQRHTPDSPHHPNTAALATTFDRSLSRVTSRTGMHSPALVIEPGTVSPDRFDGIDSLVIDEAQFLTARDVEVLADLAAGGTEVLCFGLRTDFTSQLFDGSRRLLELADRGGGAAHGAALRPLPIPGPDQRAPGRRRRHRSRRHRRGR